MWVSENGILNTISMVDPKKLFSDSAAHIINCLTGSERDSLLNDLVDLDNIEILRSLDPELNRIFEEFDPNVESMYEGLQFTDIPYFDSLDENRPIIDVLMQLGSAPARWKPDLIIATADALIELKAISNRGLAAKAWERVVSPVRRLFFRV